MKQKKLPRRWPTHFQVVKRGRVGTPILTGVVHRLDREENGVYIAACGVSTWGGDGMADADGDTTCERCKRSGG